MRRFCCQLPGVLRKESRQTLQPTRPTGVSHLCGKKINPTLIGRASRPSACWSMLPRPRAIEYLADESRTDAAFRGVPTATVMASLVGVTASGYASATGIWPPFASVTPVCQGKASGFCKLTTHLLACILHRGRLTKGIVSIRYLPAAGRRRLENRLS